MARSERGGAGKIDVTSNDYLGLSAGPREEALDAGLLGGEAALGAGSARLVRGTHPEHRELERELAAWLGFEECLVFSSGYAANVGLVSALAAPGDIVVSDALNHASIIDGCRLSRATVRVVAHRHQAALEREVVRAAAEDRVCWVVSESYFSMDGNGPEPGMLARVCREHEAALIVDEAHALGVFGPQGRGLCAEAGVVPDVLVGGLGKAFGGQGGFVASSAAVRAWLWNRARSFVFSTGVSPRLSAAMRGQLRRVRAADGQREHLATLGRMLRARFLAAGLRLPEGQHGPLVPVIVGGERETLEVAQALQAVGFHVQPIRPPTVPAGESRLRISLHAGLRLEDVEALGRAVVRLLGEGAASGTGAVDAARLSAPGVSPGGGGEGVGERARVAGRAGAAGRAGREAAAEVRGPRRAGEAEAGAEGAAAVGARAIAGGTAPDQELGARPGEREGQRAVPGADGAAGLGAGAGAGASAGASSVSAESGDAGAPVDAPMTPAGSRGSGAGGSATHAAGMASESGAGKGAGGEVAGLRGGHGVVHGQSMAAEEAERLALEEGRVGSLLAATLEGDGSAGGAGAGAADHSEGAVELGAGVVQPGVSAWASGLAAAGGDALRGDVGAARETARGTEGGFHGVHGHGESAPGGVLEGARGVSGLVSRETESARGHSGAPAESVSRETEAPAPPVVPWSAGLTDDSRPRLRTLGGDDPEGGGGAWSGAQRSVASLGPDGAAEAWQGDTAGVRARGAELGLGRGTAPAGSPSPAAEGFEGRDRQEGAASGDRTAGAGRHAQAAFARNQRRLGESERPLRHGAAVVSSTADAGALDGEGASLGQGLLWDDGEPRPERAARGPDEDGGRADAAGRSGAQGPAAERGDGASARAPDPAARRVEALASPSQARAEVGTVRAGLPRRWVVLGAGTGVGKTFVAAGLARALARAGDAVAAVKPIESGLAPQTGEGGAPQGSDARELERASFHVKHPSRHPLFGFVAPVTPALAARREGQRIDLAALQPWLAELAGKDGAAVVEVVVETAGGVFSPLSEAETNLDLALRLEPALWVLVASDRLGVLHELGATLRAMAASARLPDWIVLSAPAETDASTGTNADELAALGLGVPIVTLGRGEQEPLFALARRD